MTDHKIDFHILPTKLNRPKADQRWVPRPRLISALDNAFSRRVTLISAPAGYGKTTLIAQWLDRSDTPSAWLCLDRHDSDPDRFLSYLIASVRRVVPEFGTALEALCSAAVLPPADYLADALAGELATLKHPLAIILEDFHRLVFEPVSALLSRLVQNQPENLHLIISTRVDPPLPVAGWRVRDWLVEIRTADLRFFKEEAQAFFAPLAGPSLSGDTVEMIFNRTEGWVAGMQLARLSLASAENRESFARNFSGNHRLIADFLIDEVFARQMPEIREFLAVTALLERFCAPLCDAMLADGQDRPGSDEFLLQLEKENLFLVPLDDERVWYRYHHLFRGLLIQHTKADLTEKRKAEIFRRAGRWFAAEGLTEEALHCFLAAGDVDRAAELVEMNFDGLLDISRRALRRMLDRFPAWALKQQPALVVAQINYKLYYWDGQDIDQLFDAAEAHLNDPDCAIPEPRRRNLLANIDANRGLYLYWHRDPHGALKYSLRALESLSGAHPYAHFIAVEHAALGYAMAGARDKGLQLLDEAISAAYSSGSSYLSGFLFIQAGIHYYAGDLAGLEQVANKCLAIHKGEAVHRYWYLAMHWLLGCAAYERNQLNTATDYFQRVEQMRYQVGTRLYHDSNLGLALVALARGDKTGSREYAAAARAFALESKDPFSMVFSDSFEIRLAMASSRTPAATPPQTPPVDAVQIFLETPSLTYAEHLLYKDDPAERQAGLAYAQEAVAQLRKQHNTRQLIQFMAVQAVALHRTGRMEQALTALEEVLTMAQPLGFVRTLVDRGGPMAELLQFYREKRPDAAYARRILEAFNDTASSASTRPALQAAADNQFADLTSIVLSRREQEVLNLLDTSLANKEIADRLFISTETLKRHIYNIYRKLNVRSRMQALAEAKRQGLIAEKQPT